MKRITKFLVLAALSGAIQVPSVFALDGIVRPYQSVRGVGMGGLLLTTGLYDENFYGNPARVLANPKWKVGLPDPMVEIGSKTLDSVDKFSGGGSDVLANASSTAGNVNHARVQFTFPSAYIPGGEESKMAYAFGVITSVNTDLSLRKSFNVDPDTYVDTGLAVSVGRKFLENDDLWVGITPHFSVRASGASSFGLIDVVKGKDLTKSGGSGGHLDVDLGAQYKLPFEWNEWVFHSALALNNVLGGSYEQFKIDLLSSGLPPVKQPRIMGLGGSMRRPTLWVFTDTIVALELRDIGANPNGSIFKWVHLGGETRYGLIAIRTGLYQGYLSAGLGFDLKAIQLDLATYGEEMSLTVGDYQDRRYAIRLGFQI